MTRPDPDEQPRHPALLASRGQHMAWAAEVLDRLLQLPAATAEDRPDAFTTIGSTALEEALAGCIRDGDELPAALALVAEAVLRITAQEQALALMRDVYADARAGLAGRQATLEAGHAEQLAELRKSYDAARDGINAHKAEVDARYAAHRRKLEDLETLTGRMGQMLEHLTTTWADVEANLGWHRTNLAGNRRRTQETR